MMQPLFVYIFEFLRVLAKMFTKFFELFLANTLLYR